MEGRGVKEQKYWLTSFRLRSQIRMPPSSDPDTIHFPLGSVVENEAATHHFAFVCPAGSPRIVGHSTSTLAPLVPSRLSMCTRTEHKLEHAPLAQAQCEPLYGRQVCW